MNTLPAGGTGEITLAPPVFMGDADGRFKRGGDVLVRYAVAGTFYSISLSFHNVVTPLLRANFSSARAAVLCRICTANAHAASEEQYTVTETAVAVPQRLR